MKKSEGITGISALESIYVQIFATWVERAKKLFQKERRKMHEKYVYAAWFACGMRYIIAMQVIFFMHFSPLFLEYIFCSLDQSCENLCIYTFEGTDYCDTFRFVQKKILGCLNHISISRFMWISGKKSLKNLQCLIWRTWMRVRQKNIFIFEISVSDRP